MEKLVELLNEYEKERKSGYTWRSIDSYDNCVYGVDCDGETEITMYSDLYSKQYGFIQWLLDNDKININEEWDDYEETNLYCNSDFFQLQKHYSYYESLLMLLSIQDNPIEFLVSILR